MTILYIDILELIFKEVIKAGDVLNIYYTALINKTFYDIFKKHEKDIIMVLLDHFFERYTTSKGKNIIKILCNDVNCYCGNNVNCLLSIKTIGQIGDINYLIDISPEYGCIYKEKVNGLTIAKHNNNNDNKCFISNHDSTYDNTPLSIHTFLKKYDEKMEENTKYIRKEDMPIYNKFIELLRKYIYLHSSAYILMN